MANEIEQKIKFTGQIDQIVKSVQDIQKIIDKLQIPDSLKQNFTKAFSGLEKSAAKATEQIQNGFKSKGSVTAFEKTLNGINNQYTQIINNVKKITPEQLQKSFHIDPKDLQQAQLAVKEIQETISSKIDPSNLEKIKTTVAELQKTSKSNVLKEITDLVQQGRLDEAQAALDKLSQSANRFKDAGKQEEFKKGVSELQQTLSSITSKDDLGTLIQKLKDSKQNLSDLERVKLTEFIQQFLQMQQSADGFSKEIPKMTEGMLKTAQATQQFGSELDQFKNRITYFFGLNNAIQLVRRALRATFETVKDLDKVMTETAVVTDFTVSDMWKQLPEYTDRANKLGVAIHDTYEAATLFYQQGLKTNEVMAVSNETLKMARIAGLAAADATDRMTNALRGFNMEINETNATRVNDVYSALAAKTASNVDEISTAMTKVASLANNANMSFENTAAFLSQIIETTRESAETAGTALKTVIARFSEVKKLYSEGELLGTDSEGEAVDVNKISTALRVAGINLNEYLTGSKGLDEVFIELSKRWDGLTKVQQRYIATMAAGSRQQSRFIALMQDSARMTELTGIASNSAGASQDQFNKTLDSLESKVNQLKNAWNEYLLAVANSDVIKGFIDLLTQLLTAVNKLTGNSGIGKLAVAFGVFKGGRALLGNGLQNFLGPLMNKGNLDKIGQQGGYSVAKGLVGGLKKTFTKENFGFVQQSVFDKSKFQQALQEETRLSESQKSGLMFTETNEQLTAQSEKLKELGVDYDNLYAKSQKMETTLVPTLHNVTAAALGVGASFLAISKAFDALGWKEGAKVFNTMGVALMAVGALLPVIKSGIDGLAAAGVKAGVSIQAAFGWISLVLTAVTAVIAGVVAIVQNISEDRKFKSFEGQLERLETATQEIGEVASAAAEKVDQLTQSYKDLIALKDEINKLNPNDIEYQTKSLEYRQKVYELLKQYPELKETITFSKNGLPVIDEKKYKELLISESNVSQSMGFITAGVDLFKSRVTQELGIKNTKLDFASAFNSALGNSMGGASYKLLDYSNSTDLQFEHTDEIVSNLSFDELLKYSTGMDYQELIEYVKSQAENPENPVTLEALDDLEKARMAYLDYSLKRDSLLTEEAGLKTSTNKILISQLQVGETEQDYLLGSKVMQDSRQKIIKYVTDLNKQLKTYSPKNIASLAEDILGTKVDLSGNETNPYKVEGKEISSDTLIQMLANRKYYNEIYQQLNEINFSALSKQQKKFIDTSADYTMAELKEFIAEEYTSNIKGYDDESRKKQLNKEYTELSNIFDIPSDLLDSLNVSSLKKIKKTFDNLGGSLNKNIILFSRLIDSMNLAAIDTSKFIDIFSEIDFESPAWKESLVNNIKESFGDGFDVNPIIKYAQSVEQLNNIYKDLNHYDISNLLNAWKKISDKITKGELIYTEEEKKSAIESKLFSESDFRQVGEQYLLSSSALLSKQGYSQNFIANLLKNVEQTLSDTFSNLSLRQYVNQKMQNVPDTVEPELRAQIRKGLEEDYKNKSSNLLSTAENLRAIAEFAASVGAVSEVEQAINDIKNLKLKETESWGLDSLLITAQLQKAQKDAENVWTNPYDVLYNLTKKEEALIQKRETYQREYNALLRNQNSTTEQILQNYKNQLSTLNDEKKAQNSIISKADSEIRKILGGSGYYGKYYTYDSATRTIQLNQNELDKITTKDVGDAVQAEISQLENLAKSANGAVTKLDDIDKSIYDLNQEAINSYLSLEDKTLNALVSQREQELSTLESIYSTLEDSMSAVISNMREQIENERQARENEKTEQDIADKEARLQYLRRDTSGARDLEIRQLEKEIAESREQYTDTLIDQSINNLENEAQRAAEQRQTQIEIMREQLELERKGTMWEQVDKLVAGAIDKNGKVIVDSPLMQIWKEADKFEEQSATRQQELLKEYERIIKEAARMKGFGGENTSSSTPTSTNPGSSSPSGSNTPTTSTTAGYYPQYTGGSNSIADALASLGIDGSYSNRARIASANGISGYSGTADQNGLLLSLLKQGKLKKYASGGLVDFTGPAWLDGTRAKPEMVLSAADTENFIALRNILGGIVQSGTDGAGLIGNTYYDINIDAELASDYDVDQMAERIKQIILSNSQYRNVNSIKNMR